MSSAPLAQRRDLDREHVQPVVEVLPEASLANLLQQVAVRGRHQPHVHLQRLRAPQTLELARLQHAQQLRLHLERGLAHLVQEQRRAVRHVEAARLARQRSGEGAPLAPEQLALHEPRRQRRAVDLHHHARAAAALPVQRLGDELLSAAGLAAHEHRCVGGRDLLHELQHPLDGGALPGDLAVTAHDADLRLQVVALRLQPVLEALDLRERLAQRLLSLLPLRDVADHAERLDDPRAGVALRHAGHVVEPALAPRRVQVAVVDVEPLDFTLVQATPGFQHALAIFGVQAREPLLEGREAVPILRRDAAHVAEAVVHEGDALLEVHLVEREPGEVGAGREARLARAERLLGALALVDVFHNRDEVPGLPQRRSRQRDGQVDPHPRTVPADVALLHGVGLDLAGEHLPHVGEVPVEVVGVGDVLERQPQQLLARVADDRAEPVVDAQEAALQADVGNAHGRLLERRPAELFALLQGQLVPPAREGVREDLRHELQALHHRVRPIALRPHRVERQGAHGRLAPDRERDGQVRLDAAEPRGCPVDGSFRRHVPQRRQDDQPARQHLLHAPGVVLADVRVWRLERLGRVGVGGRHDPRLARRPLPEHRVVDAESRADATQGVLDRAVHLARGQVDEAGGEVGDQRLELETTSELPGLRLRCDTAVRGAPHSSRPLEGGHPLGAYTVPRRIRRARRAEARKTKCRPADAPSSSRRACAASPGGSSDPGGA